MMFRKPVNTELLPCPFCGKAPILSAHFGKLSAGCRTSGCIQPSTWPSVPNTTDLKDVARVWNARPARRMVPEPQPDQQEEGEVRRPDAGAPA